MNYLMKKISNKIYNIVNDLRLLEYYYKTYLKFFN